MQTAKSKRPPITFERTYDAPVEDLWDLWTTKDGFESWWGPEGFRVEVHALDLRVGGALLYDMIAVDPQQIAWMEKAGMPVSHETRGTFTEVEPPRRLKITHVIDFIPGMESYENTLSVDLVPTDAGARMTVTIEAHPDDEWTRRSAEGMESQLRKLPAALAGLHG